MLDYDTAHVTRNVFSIEKLRGILPEIPRFPIRPLSRPISFQKRCLFINTFDSIDIVSSLLRDKGMREKNPRDGINVNRNEIRLIKGAAVPKERTVAACYAPFRRLTLFKGL